MLKSIRKFENLHIACWLLKDTCWVLDMRVFGVIMIFPTLFLSFFDENSWIVVDQYLDIVTAKMLDRASMVLDIGCGTGRWATYLASRVKFI